MRLFVCSPLQMQGSLFRHSPSLLSSSLRTSLSRRISWYQTTAPPWSDHSPLSWKSRNPSSPPVTAAASSAHSPDPALLPLPSSSAAARAERFRVDDDGNGPLAAEERFRSVGSRSDPSRPSIPGKFSKYSKPISKLHTESSQKRAERRDKKAFRKPMGDVAARPDLNVVRPDGSSSSESGAAAAAAAAAVSSPVPKDSKSPLSESKLPEWMEHYQFSYSEVPTAPIIGFRQTPWSPFGPEDMLDRPWTGSAPLKPTKKKLPVFDSFQPPPPGKKGVKYVQPPGPFPPGEGPKAAKSREEVLGAPLTPLEIQELVNAVNKRNKQVNLGRDGLTHNMLDVVHSHWKRSVCCKVKCKGVPTLDMDNVVRVVEEKTGGVVIQRAGGVMFVFRGRNYNYKDVPKIPIMLWKPPDPIYPRLIVPVPEGLTEHEAARLRGQGRKVSPLCRLSKNGVYLTLVADVKAQMEIDDVVKVDCKGLHATDYKKIGAKLKDLVPCTLLSFEKEQIIMCRKRPPRVEGVQQPQEGEEAGDVPIDGGTSTSLSNELPVKEESVVQADNYEQNLVVAKGIGSTASQFSSTAIEADIPQAAVSSLDGSPQDQSVLSDGNVAVSLFDSDIDRNAAASGTDVITRNEFTEELTSVSDGIIRNEFTEELTSVTDESSGTSSSDGTDDVIAASSMGSVDSVEELWQRAIEEGSAFQLDNQAIDPDVVLEKATELSGILDVAAASEEEARLNNEKKLEEERDIQEKKTRSQISSTSPFDVPPMGGLAVDELAKLLGPSK